VSTPDVGQSELLSVAAVSSTNVWAVGNRVYKTLIEHWNGLRWTVVANPDAPYGFLAGIVALSPRNIWAVGGRYLDTAGTKQNSLIEHWDGAMWRRAGSPFRRGTVVTSISARSSGDIWIGGEGAVSLAPVALARRMGTTWRLVRPPHVKGGLGLVYSAAAKNDVWAMGNVWSDADSSVHGFVDHYGCR
jgi:hypothetical protein